MKINTAKFIKGIKGSDKILQDGKIQIAFVGRSNVGKSSVINSLTRKKNLVKSSSIPGKTREINFFIINNKFYFVDLPGYGFARIRWKQREKLRKLILWYLTTEEVKSKKVILIIDFKIGPTEFDIDMISFLRNKKVSFLIVLNKVDKISKGVRLKQLNKIMEKIGVSDIILYSAKTGEGREKLLSQINN